MQGLSVIEFVVQHPVEQAVVTNCKWWGMFWKNAFWIEQQRLQMLPLIQVQQHRKLEDRAVPWSSHVSDQDSNIFLVRLPEPVSHCPNAASLHLQMALGISLVGPRTVSSDNPTSNGVVVDWGLSSTSIKIVQLIIHKLFGFQSTVIDDIY